MHMIFTKIQVILLGMLFWFVSSELDCFGNERQDSVAQNLARGKSCTLVPKPNYGLFSNVANDCRLTDGVVYEGKGCFWLQPSTVGWNNISAAIITIDLGKMEPIGGMSFHTSFDGPMNVMWPQSIKMFVSEDGENYIYLGDMVNLSWDEKLPPELAPFGEEPRKVFHAYSAKVEAKGRYVRMVVQSPLIFCDEIEIFKGNAELLQKPVAGQKVSDIRAFLCDLKPLEDASIRLLRDLSLVRKRVSRLKPGDFDSFEKRISEIGGEIAERKSSCFPVSKAITPLNQLHRRILQINAGILRKQNFPALVVWRKNRWDELDALEEPPSPDGKIPSLFVGMMDHEYRAEACNVTNAGDEEVELMLSFEGLPGGAMPEYITVLQCEFIGVLRGRVIADPLTVVGKTREGFVVRVPSGMTRQIWLSFHPRGIDAGSYRGSLRMKAKGRDALCVPLTFQIYPFRFPDQPHLTLCLWDYTDKPYGFKSITDDNVDLAIKDLREHFLSPWAHRESACWPEKGDFDVHGNLTKSLRGGGFDAWTSKWKGARRYFFCLGRSLSDFRSFCGEPAGTSRFDRMVGQWAAALAMRARNAGIHPSQIVFEFLDEPGKEEAFRINAAWAKAVKTGAPEILLYTNGSHFSEFSEAHREMIKFHDILSPSFWKYGGVPESLRRLLRERGEAKEFFLSDCVSNMNLLDPYYYHRLRAWHCWKNGAQGVGFWDYWNYSIERGTDWTENVFQGLSYGVVYTTNNSVTTSKHWEAVREGVEDYEYLYLLKKRLDEIKGAGGRDELRTKAEHLLATLPDEVAGQYDKRQMPWPVPKNRSRADEARIQIMEMLLALRSE
ncbi:MAG: hypothetical protein PHV34_10110 [Verrucomicrobiae bacterium]|nr:hypothetical protein [Verrucomicrobiae bacterium]